VNRERPGVLRLGVAVVWQRPYHSGRTAHLAPARPFVGPLPKMHCASCSGPSVCGPTTQDALRILCRLVLLWAHYPRRTAHRVGGRPLVGALPTTHCASCEGPSFSGPTTQDAQRILWGPVLLWAHYPRRTAHLVSARPLVGPLPKTHCASCGGPSFSGPTTQDALRILWGPVLLWAHYPRRTAHLVRARPLVGPLHKTHCASCPLWLRCVRTPQRIAKCP
jgi:hypothetical protein